MHINIFYTSSGMLLLHLLRMSWKSYYILYIEKHQLGVRVLSITPSEDLFTMRVSFTFTFDSEYREDGSSGSRNREIYVNTLTPEGRILFEKLQKLNPNFP